MSVLEKAMNESREMARTGNLNGLTLSAAEDIWFGLQDMLHGKAATTIAEKVAKWFSQRGFAVTPKGIGWAITPGI